MHPPVKAPKPTFSPKIKKSPPPLPVKPHPRQHAAPPKPSNENSNSRVLKIAVIVASSVASLALIALFLFCCLRGRKNKIGPRDGQRDENPLLNFCLSDLSNGIYSDN